jgi:hypothetical protein
LFCTSDLDGGSKHRPSLANRKGNTRPASI